MTTVAIFTSDTGAVLCTEQPHPADSRFTAYQRKDGQWLGVSPDGSLTFTAAVGSFQAFKAAENATYLLADRTAFGGGVSRLPYVAYSEPAGPVA